MSDAPTRPILRYHGGKWMLAPWIVGYFPMHRTYVEPFGGAASCLLRKPRSYSEVYNDLDQEVVNLFRVCRTRGEDLASAISLTPFSREEFNLSYHRSADEFERARRLIVRSFMGFGSDGVNGNAKTGFRALSNRSGTTPEHDWVNYPDALRVIVGRLRGVVIENEPALKVIDRFDSPDTLFYVDPPYVHSTRARVDRGRGYHHELSDAEHVDLAEVLHRIQGKVVLSGYHSELYDRLYSDWPRVEKTGPFSDGARERTEVLWFKNRDADLFSHP